MIEKKIFLQNWLENKIKSLLHSESGYETPEPSVHKNYYLEMITLLSYLLK